MQDESRGKLLESDIDRLARILACPELIGLTDAARFHLGSAPGPWFCQVRPGEVILDPSLLDGPADIALILQFAGELAAWQQRIPALSSGQDRPAILAAALSNARLMEVLPPRAGLASAPDWLCALQKESRCDGQLDPDIQAVAAPTAWLMVQDCDPRLDLDPVSRRNRYGCSALPMSQVIELASSTAASTSVVGWQAAEQLRHRLIAAALGGALQEELMAAGQQLAHNLLSLLDLEKQAVAILAASGTTAALLATCFCLQEGKHGTQILMLGAEEAGSGTPLAIGGRHSSARTPSGSLVCAGAAVEGIDAERLFVSSIAIRDNAGRPIAKNRLMEQIEGAITMASQKGHAVILHAVESSKTGLVAPGLDVVLELRRRHNIAVIVDACQMRTDARLLARYLEAGCLVTVTGSKFYGGPPFSGALLVPRDLASGPASLPAGLAAYSWQGDWPRSCQDQLRALPRGGSPGLYLRWQAALADMATFSSFSESMKTAALRAFGQAVRDALEQFPELQLLPGYPGTEEAGSGHWSDLPSIFTLAVRNPVDGAWLTEPSLRRLHAILNLDATSMLPNNGPAAERLLAQKLCHLGQPVAVSHCPPGLRLAAGARQIMQWGDDPAVWSQQVGTILEKLRLLLRTLLSE